MKHFLIALAGAALLCAALAGLTGCAGEVGVDTGVYYGPGPGPWFHDGPWVYGHPWHGGRGWGGVHPPGWR